MSNVVAILCADLHISEKAPVARSAEPDWFAAQARSLRELQELLEKYDAPVICAGDVFDSWRASPATINFALEELPERFYAIPGQHDLPNHNLDEIERSAYRTLERAGVLYPDAICTDGTVGPTVIGKGWVFYGFPWGAKVQSYGSNIPEIPKLAVIHAYCWKKGSGYPGAPPMAKVEHHRDSLQGYDVALFGDNHTGFLWKGGKGDTTIFNAGTFFRRRSDEIDYRPMVGLLHEDGEVEIHYLDVSQDKFLDHESIGQVEQAHLDLGGFVEQLKGLGDSGLDFREALLRSIEVDDCDESVSAIIRTVLEGE